MNEDINAQAIRTELSSIRESQHRMHQAQETTKETMQDLLQFMHENARVLEKQERLEQRVDSINLTITERLTRLETKMWAIGVGAGVAFALAQHLVKALISQ